MPTSTYEHIPALVTYLQFAMPNSILDVGLGNGKMGFVARDLLDVMLGQRYRKEDWRVRIDGIEIFDAYIQEHQRAIYDNIHIGDAMEVIDELGTYDLVLLCDVVEHFEKDKAWALLDKCFGHCSRYGIVGIPLGEKWTQPPIYGNPHEEHKSFWTVEEFGPMAEEKFCVAFPTLGDYGCFLIRKEDYLYHRMQEKIDRLLSEGRHAEAIRSLEASHSDITCSYLLVDLLLKVGRIDEAIERLMRIQRDFPDDSLAEKYIGTLQAVQRESVTPAMK